jgi:hypothetical protein
MGTCIRSAEIGKRREVMLRRAAGRIRGRTRSAEWSAAVRREAIPHVEAPASAAVAADSMVAAVADHTVAAAGINSGRFIFPGVILNQTWGDEICSG